MNAIVEKIGEKKGKERFILVCAKTGSVITKKDVSESTMVRFLKEIGESKNLIAEALEKARKRFDKAEAAKDDEEELDDIFSEVAFDDDDGDIH